MFHFSLIIFSLFYEGDGLFGLGNDVFLPSSRDAHFTGDMTLVQFWDYVLLADEIRAIHTFCEDFAGTLLSWTDFRSNIRGNLSVSNSTFCSGKNRQTTLSLFGRKAHNALSWVCPTVLSTVLQMREFVDNIIG